MTDVSTTWAEVIFRFKLIVFVSRWCYKSGPPKLTGGSEFSHDGFGWKIRVKFVNSHWSVSIRHLLANFS